MLFILQYCTIPTDRLVGSSVAEPVQFEPDVRQKTSSARLVLQGAPEAKRKPNKLVRCTHMNYLLSYTLSSSLYGDTPICPMFCLFGL